MTAPNGALKDIKQLLLLDRQIEGLELASEIQAAAVGQLTQDVVAIDKRVVRLETMVEIGAARAALVPRLPEQ